MTAITLAELARKIGCPLEPGFESAPVSGVSQSHSRVSPGDIFVASQGAISHGMDFATLAVQAGAVAVITDRWQEGANFHQLLVEDPKSKIGSLCNLIYEPITARLWGVTGTNGKTSTVTYLFRLLQLLGANPALSGSTGFVPTSNVPSDGLTTPEADVLHRQIRAWQNSGINEIVIEVSAQALTRHRVSGLKFAVSGFTNLSHDHLDEYGDMERYQRAKSKLFSAEYSQRAVIATEDKYGKSIFSESNIPKVSLDYIEAEGGVGYRLLSEPGFSLARADQTLINADVNPGALMAKNLALALAMLLEAGFSSESLEAVLPRLTLEVTGRLQRVNPAGGDQPAVFLDYAHTPDAIRSAIAELRGRGFVRVNLVFSASGDRDHSKRPEMANAASGADYILVTDFHPRSEDPKQIRDELGATLARIGAKFADVADPAQAIQAAIAAADAETAVLWCGPGHLKYREIGGIKVAFDPELVVKNALGGRS